MNGQMIDMLRRHVASKFNADNRFVAPCEALTQSEGEDGIINGTTGLPVGGESAVRQVMVNPYAAVGVTV